MFYNSEFKNHLHKHIEEKQQPIALTNHNEIIGYYIPKQPQPPKKDLESLQKSVTRLSNILAEKGISEDDIVADFQQLRKQAY
jgi:PHD/YefM family antitoxin component YafN of YafNO toxin-antitoxin module